MMSTSLSSVDFLLSRAGDPPFPLPMSDLSPRSRRFAPAREQERERERERERETERHRRRVYVDARNIVIERASGRITPFPSLDSPGGLMRSARYATRKKKGEKNETEQSEGRERVLYPLPSSFSRRHLLAGIQESVSVISMRFPPILYERSMPIQADPAVINISLPMLRKTDQLPASALGLGH